MKPVKLLLFFLLLLALIPKANSQSFFYNDKYYDNPIVYEFGAGLGGMNCIVDIGGANSDRGIYINEIHPSNTRLSASVYAGAMYQNFIGLRLMGTIGSVTANDNMITSQASLNLITKNNRNLNFRSNITEATLLAEFHPFMIRYYENGTPLLSPYILAGVGYFGFRPQGKYNDTWIDLKPLHTEGQGFTEYKFSKPYKLTDFNIPIGGGLRYELSDKCNVRLEFLHRVLRTDYLDDAHSRTYVNPAVFSKYLSPRDAAYARALYNPSKNGKNPPRRSNPNDNDAYMTFSIKFGIVVGRDRR
jgi:hypothetical protein